MCTKRSAFDKNEESCKDVFATTHWSVLTSAGQVDSPEALVLEGHPQTPLDRDRAGNYFVVGQIQDAIATHTASDIPLSALGRHAHLFTGVMDNTDVFFKIMRVALGDAKITQELHQQLNHP